MASFSRAALCKEFASPHQPSQSHLEALSCLPHCPVFYPTVDEYSNPLTYIESIRSRAEPFGCCLIVPPHHSQETAESLSQRTFSNLFENCSKYGTGEELKFVTKSQPIHKLKWRENGPNERFLTIVDQFLKSQPDLSYGLPATPPIVGGYPLDFYLFFRCVYRYGGHETVSAKHLWAVIARELGYEGAKAAKVSSTLKSHYEKYLARFSIQFNLETFSDSYPSSSSFAEHSNGPSSSSSSSTEETEPFGFVYSSPMPLCDYQLSADDFKAHHFRVSDFDSIPLSRIEQEYWSIINAADCQVEVQYGSDINVLSTKASCFPLVPQTGVRRSPRKPSSFPQEALPLSKPQPTESVKDTQFNPWNLNQLSCQEASMVKHLTKPICGINTPYLYIGMCFSSFCWHTEDNYLYSINYLHSGAPKQWYVIPSSGKELFDQAMQKILPEQFRSDSRILYALVTQISPVELQLYGVPVYKAIHYPGTAMITFPAAYHSGFNYGFNIAESINFATYDWMKWALRSVLDYRLVPRHSVFNFQRFVLEALNSGQYTRPEEHRELVRIFSEIYEAEASGRQRLLDKGIRQLTESSRAVNPYCCCRCLIDCWISYVKCNAHRGRYSCLDHTEYICDCSLPAKTLIVHHQLSALHPSLSEMNHCPSTTSPDRYSPPRSKRPLMAIEETYIPQRQRT